MFVPLLTSVRLAAVALFNWLTFTASVELIPAATLVIVLLFILMPLALMTGPPLLRLRLSAVRFGVVAMVKSLPLRVMAMLLPLLKLTWSPDLMNCPVSPFALAVKPVLLTALTISPAVAKRLALLVLAIPPVLVIGAVTATTWLALLTVVVIPSVATSTL